MPVAADDLTFGIEEEFFVVDLRTRSTVARVPKAFVKACQSRLGEAITFEFMQSQIEIVSPILSSSAQALETMTRLRAGVAEVAAAMGLGIIGAGTHPLARWQQQRPTDKPRYARFMETFQIIGARDFVCGLHIHVAVPEGDRVQLMNRLMPWMPLFLALSTSSPFWNLRRSGLYSYRQCAYSEWPRAGIPDFFDDEADYARFVGILAGANAVRDASEMWWCIRPSLEFPTLEMRIADSCTRVEDSVALAMLFRCLVSAHLRLPTMGIERTTATRRVIEENRWRAARFGLEAEFIDETKRRTVSVSELIAEVLNLVEPDSTLLDPDNVLGTLTTILARGTSAHAQLQVYDDSTSAGARHKDALRSVVDWLLDTTVPGRNAVRL